MRDNNVRVVLTYFLPSHVTVLHLARSDVVLTDEMRKKIHDNRMKKEFLYKTYNTAPNNGAETFRATQMLASVLRWSVLAAAAPLPSGADAETSVPEDYECGILGRHNSSHGAQCPRPECRRLMSIPYLVG
jgi:hypothetical protein